ncbi:outer membrane beta-barrel protein [Elizabethkingia argentiflava]|uniref:Outer membrane beta-barrel protein n=1 Tax=Elizabethkingia argenteiflava TaxID=2681556 RepID=A0A845PUG4_9FLAO|nr:outer membrane beta-barrel protein [Elizabethkingia argenteiflava]
MYAAIFKQHVQRPGIALLNPLILKKDPYFSNTGNPNLKPVLINNIGFEYSRFKKTAIALGLNYIFSKNTIQRITQNRTTPLY